MSKAFIFPGQGSQIVGMGKDFYDNFPVAKETFSMVSDSLNYNLTDIIFNGPENFLMQTEHTQPALMTVSIAIVRVINDLLKCDLKHLCQYVAGHSLGEYTALAASNSLTITDAAKLLSIRGKSMQSACREGKGMMLACLGINVEELENLIVKNITTGVCQIANDNIEGQIVVSGDKDNIELLITTLKNAGYKAIPLKVSAPFHCDLMLPVAKIMQNELSLTNIVSPIVPIITNTDVEVTTEPDIICQALVKQVYSKVRWRETLDKLVTLGVSEIVEIGSGKVLTNMLKRSNLPLKTTNISNIDELDKFIKTL